MNIPAIGLDDHIRQVYRADFTARVATGELRPMVIPYSLLGAFVIPTLWLSLPHKQHPWLFQTRWLLIAFIVIFDLYVVHTTSSGNLAISYATGLGVGWGIIHNFNLLIWTRPLETAARIIKRPISKHSSPGPSNGDSLRHGLSSSLATSHEVPNEDGETVKGLDGGAEILRYRNVESKQDSGIGAAKEQMGKEYEYVWEPFPGDAPFADRFNWALDLETSFRGCGWNWAISCLPRPNLPSDMSRITPVDMGSMPIRSRSGFSRCTSEAEFKKSRLLTVVVMYLTVDFLAITMAMDPYFVLGPDHPVMKTSASVPQHLQSLHPILLRWLRQLMSLAGFLGAISGVFNLNAIVQQKIAPYLFPSRGELWRYPTVFGSFSCVLDRGLAGWWGSWWHQTFRAQFMAPAAYLVREGFVSKGSIAATLAALIVSFAQSGIMHAFGSASTIPHTQLWRAPLFFMLQAPGIIIQHLLSIAVRKFIPTPPRRLAQFGNLAFTLLWIQWTSKWFCDDIASAGIWLCDPVPLSPLRMAGLGHPGERWWRWEKVHYPSWHTGAHWWESGLAL